MQKNCYMRKKRYIWYYRRHSTIVLDNFSRLGDDTVEKNGHSHRLSPCFGFSPSPPGRGFLMARQGRHSSEAAREKLNRPDPKPAHAKRGDRQSRTILARISHSPPAAIAYLMPSPGLVLIADFDVFQYAFTRLTATNPGSVTIYAISLRSL
jgi:hypothetical protein